MISQKGFYGLLSGIFTTSFLQPFENVKMALMFPPKDLVLRHNFVSNFLQATRYIFNLDGYKGFYKGFVAQNIKAGLGCYIYFTILRYFGKEDTKLYYDFLLSSIARIISTIFTNPFNIIATRYQLADFHKYTSIKGAMLDIYRNQGPLAFFSGAMASCWKEGFFAGLYYMMYEELKDRGYHKMYAGIASGMISTAITHPIEIIRASIMTQGLTEHHSVKQHLIVQEIRRLRKQGGWFKGLTPRLFKKPLSNTLTFYMFELIEDYKKSHAAKN